jgi:hypothetical protein
MKLSDIAARAPPCRCKANPTCPPWPEDHEKPEARTHSSRRSTTVRKPPPRTSSGRRPRCERRAAEHAKHHAAARERDRRRVERPCRRKWKRPSPGGETLPPPSPPELILPGVTPGGGKEGGRGKEWEPSGGAAWSPPVSPEADPFFVWVVWGSIFDMFSFFRCVSGRPRELDSGLPLFESSVLWCC